MPSPKINKILLTFDVNKQYKENTTWRSSVSQASARKAQLSMIEQVITALKTDEKLNDNQKAAVLRCVVAEIEEQLTKEGNKSKGLAAVVKNLKQALNDNNFGADKQPKTDDKAFVDFYNKHREELDKNKPSKALAIKAAKNQDMSLIREAVAGVTQSQKVGFHIEYAEHDAIQQAYNKTSREVRKWLRPGSHDRQIQIAFLQDIIRTTNAMEGNRGYDTLTGKRAFIGYNEEQFQVLQGSINLIKEQLGKGHEHTRLGKVVDKMEKSLHESIKGKEFKQQMMISCQTF